MTALRVYLPEECGPDGYPLAWHSIDGGPGIKHRVREAAGYRCVRCHHPYAKGDGPLSRCDWMCSHPGPVEVRDRFGDLRINGEQEIDADQLRLLIASGLEVYALWRVLTVHHLTMDKRDCRWWNLAALDQRCHLRIQTTVQMGRVYPFEHSEWFKPYAAGWYAWTYLGEELSRGEVEERLPELLALEQMA